MANHLTPSELANEAGLEREEVLSKCIEMGVPVFHGCIDKSLFLASLHEEQDEHGFNSGPVAHVATTDSGVLMQHAA